MAEADIYDCVWVTSTDGWGGKIEEQCSIEHERHSYCAHVSCKQIHSPRLY